MADDAFTIVIDERGNLTVAGADAQHRLAARPGRYRLVPSPPDLVILERSDEDGLGDLTTQGVVLAGEIERIGGLVEIIHLLQGNGWSGHLTVLSGGAKKTLYLKRGDITSAASSVPEDRIGAILYRFGMITTSDLESALAQWTPDQRVGQILIERGKLTAHQLYVHIRKQIEEIFYSLLAARRGEYYFYRTDEAACPPSQIHLSTKELLFEGVRRIDEMSYFQQKIPNPEVVPVLRGPPEDLTLPPRWARILELIDGRRDLAAIARESHLGEFEATKLLFQLLHEGWVEVRARLPVNPALRAAATLGEIVDAYNDVYARIHGAIAAQGQRPALARDLASFFQSKDDFAPLFAGVTLLPDGRAPRAQLLANLDIAPVSKKADYLHRGLNELLFFVLFTAGEAVDRQQEAELHRRLDAILADLMRREG